MCKINGVDGFSGRSVDGIMSERCRFRVRFGCNDEKMKVFME